MDLFPPRQSYRWTFSLLLVGMAVLTFAKGAPGRDVRMGTLSKISGEKATIALEKAAPVTSSTEALAYRPMEVRAGMTVRLVVMMGTAVFSMPIGTVDKVAEDGNSCVMVVDDGLLDAPVEDPSSGNKAVVRDFYKEGAEVSISR